MKTYVFLVKVFLRHQKSCCYSIYQLGDCLGQLSICILKVPKNKPKIDHLIFFAETSPKMTIYLNQKANKTLLSFLSIIPPTHLASRHNKKRIQSLEKIEIFTEAWYFSVFFCQWFEFCLERIRFFSLENDYIILQLQLP